MEPTRRSRTPPLPRPPAAMDEDQRTRLKPEVPSRPGNLRFEERLALFVHSLDRANAAALLQMLHDRHAGRALAYLQRLESMPSAERQGNLAAQFGVRTDAPERLRELWAEAPVLLRADLYRALPPFLRTLFPGFKAGAPSEGPEAALRRAFAERLVREATR